MTTKQNDKKSLMIPKWVIRIRKSKNDIHVQCNGKKKKDKGTNNTKQYTEDKRWRNTNPTKNRERTQMFRKGRQFQLHMLQLSCYAVLIIRKRKIKSHLF